MDKEIVVKNLEILKNEYLGCGHFGNVYLTNDNNVYKEFFNTRNDPYLSVKLQQIKNDSFAFPETLVFDDDEKTFHNYRGYIRKYIKGNTLNNIDRNVEIRNIVNALKVLESDIVKLSYNDVIANDFDFKNLIYSDEGKIIDIDCGLFRIGCLLSNTDILNESVESLSSNVLMPRYFIHNCFKSDKINKMVFDYMGYGKNNPSDVIEYILYSIEKEKKEEIITIDDFDKSLKLIMR